MLKKIVIAFGLLISAFVLVVGGLYVKGGQAEILLWVVKIFIREEHACPPPLSTVWRSKVPILRPAIRAMPPVRLHVPP